MIEAKFVELIAHEVNARPEQAAAAAALLDKGATVPFIARYRRDITGNLDGARLEKIEERNSYFTALSNRRDAILQNIENQGLLTEELREKILAVTNQATLEDLYLPFKKQRRSKSTVALEQGLGELAGYIFAQAPDGVPVEEHAASFVNPEKHVNSVADALAGAHLILAERISMDAGIRAMLRDAMFENGKVVASEALKPSRSAELRVAPGKEKAAPLDAAAPAAAPAEAPAPAPESPEAAASAPEPPAPEAAQAPSESTPEAAASESTAPESAAETAPPAENAAPVEDTLSAETSVQAENTAPADASVEDHAAAPAESASPESAPEASAAPEAGAPAAAAPAVPEMAAPPAKKADSPRPSAKSRALEAEKGRFEPYYHFSEPVKSVRSHRLLAVMRGMRLGELRVGLEVDDNALLRKIGEHIITAPGTSSEGHLRGVIEDAYRRLLRPAIESEVLGLARERADSEAIHVFRENARSLLLGPPAGRIPVLGVAPGLRNGCKLAVVDASGAYKEGAVIFPVHPNKNEEEAEQILTRLVTTHEINAIAIGNGAGSREAGRFIDGVLAKLGRPEAFTVFVNEAGAAVYSTSKLAREEFPDLDVASRAAISVARRLQDPLTELVKIEPRSIGVGQYQHDVNQRQLREGLYRTVEACVNMVGADLNAASAEMLRYVSGIQLGTARNIVELRTRRNGFTNRQQLREVPGIGDKTFEQCAGFLRITGGEQPLDGTAIHPEAYPIVEKIAESLGLSLTEMLAAPEKLREVDLAQFENETIGKLALRDIRNELVKPGRDPRKEFRVPKFIEGVTDIANLTEGMISEGLVTNVTDFGAFIDIGVHQDGLVHLSELANRFVRDPREFIKVGEIVRVKVVKVDQKHRRISLSIKALLPPPRKRPRPSEAAAQQEGPPRERAQAGGERARTGAPARDGERTARPPRRNEGDAPRRDHDQRRDRGDRDAPRKRHEKRRDAKPAERQQRHQSGSDEPIGVSMADQLAALKEKFNRN